MCVLAVFSAPEKVCSCDMIFKVLKQWIVMDLTYHRNMRTFVLVTYWTLQLIEITLKQVVRKRR